MTAPALVYLPGAGADAATFRSWGAVLPGVEIRTPSRPGKAARWSEHPLGSVEAMAQDVIDQVEGWDDRPLVLLGFSLGALVAYEAAMRLAPTRRALKGLVVAGSRPPDLPESAVGIHELDDKELRAAVGAFSPGARAAMTDDDLTSLLLPGIRADFAAAAAYERHPDHRDALDLPILSIAGREDEVAPPSTCRHWRRFTQGAFEAVTVSGGHGFLEDPRDDLARPLLRVLGASRDRDAEGDDVSRAAEPAASGRADRVHAAVRAAWESSLGRADFGDETDFFALGGSSLLAARVVAMVGKDTAVKVRLRRFLAAPTVLGLVAVVADAQENA